MSLHKLLAQQPLTILGLNSGTSADGLDMAVLRLAGRGRRESIQFITGKHKPYPEAIRAEVLRLVDGSTVTLEQVIRLDSLLGQFFGQAAVKFIETVRHDGILVDAVASHGQTVYHLPAKAKLAGYATHGTLQLGTLAQIAARTGRVTVGDFRQADVALGHEGAPITVAAMARIFANPKESRLILNIGGMANFFYFPKGHQPATNTAADTGPGNSLTDLLSQRLYGEKYDRGGHHARAGKCSKRLLTLVLAHPFFAGKTVSTGREFFGAILADRMLAEGRRLKLAPDDLLATAVEITVQGICLKVRPILDADSSLQKLYLTGGGVRNSFMRERLAAVLPQAQIGSVEELGYDPSLVEASAYAVMGAACLHGEPLPTRFVGGKQQVLPVLGKIVQPPVLVK